MHFFALIWMSSLIEIQMYDRPSKITLIFLCFSVPKWDFQFGKQRGTHLYSATPHKSLLFLAPLNDMIEYVIVV